MHDAERVDRWIEGAMPDSIAELSRLVAQPSIAAQGVGMPECAALVAGMLERRGFRVEVLPSGGAPVVVAERDGVSDRTLLVYNHYDVQPAEPLESWTSPPFTPQVRDGKLFGRGVSDDKGHLVARLLAIDALLAVRGGLPCRVKFLVEGEEEVGSVHLPAFVRDHRERLAADACLWEFGGIDAHGIPEQYAGLRGICYVELSVQTATMDAHSGVGGSIFPNAAWRLVWALASLKGPDERIRIAGHYDNVKPPTARDRELFAALPDVADEYRETYGIQHFLHGLTGGAELQVAGTFQPTCTICGITTGYQGPGSKTILPARASAKVDFRLVPDQTPQEILGKLRTHLDAHGFGDVQVTFLGGNPAGRTDPDHPFLALVNRTGDELYGKPAAIVPMVGGSGPNHCFVHELGVPIAGAGCGYPGSNVHAPDENVRLDLYQLHARHVARLLSAFGAGD